MSRSDGLTGADPRRLGQHRQLVEDLGGSYHHIVGDNVSDALLSFARAENATQLVLGGSRRSRLSKLVSGAGIGGDTIRDSGDIDVHIVTHAQIGRGTGLTRRQGALSGRRWLLGLGLAIAVPILLTVVLSANQEVFNLTTEVLAFLLAVIVVALVGGLWPAVVAAVGGSVLLNYFFTPPLGTFSIAEANNALALAVFVVVAFLVSSVVDRAARRTRQAASASAEAETLATLAGNVLRGETGLPALLKRVRESFGMTSVALLEQTASGWQQIAGTDSADCQRPEDSDAAVPARDDLVLVLARAAPRRRRTPHRRRLRRPRHRDGRPRAAERSSSGSQAAGRGRPTANRTAAGRRPRSPDPAGRGQSFGEQPAQPRHRVAS